MFAVCLTSRNSYEGERTQCRDNRLLGEFELTGIPPMPRGQAELVTTFEVDANGLLKVSAQDRASGRKASISMYAPHLARLRIHCLQVSPIPLVASRRQKLTK